MTTQTITPIEILKSRQNFADYVEKHSEEVISEVLKNYPKRLVNVITHQLTPSDEGLIDAVENFENIKNGYVFYFIVNEKECISKVASTLNELFSKNFGIFIIKAYNLNNEKIEFKCIVKPDKPEKAKRYENTPAKLLQKKYWDKYLEVCDRLESDMQINPAPQHFQYIRMGKAGVQIMQTINTKAMYIATEIMINNNKEIYNKLFEHKAKIEKELGELDWQSLETNKSSRIRKTNNIDITDENNWENVTEIHVKMAEDFKATFSKYL